MEHRTQIASTDGLILDRAAGRTSALVVGTVIGTLRAALRFGAFLCLTLLATIAAQLGWLVHLVGSEASRWRWGAGVLRTYCRLIAWTFGLRLSVRGRRPEPGALVAANHHSYLDIVVMAAAAPSFFLSKAEVAAWPVIGWAAAAVGIPFVRRNDPHSRTRAADAVLDRLEAGLNVVNFPEGTTTASSRPLPFRPGLFRRLAGRSIRIVPATIRYASPDAYWIGDDTFLRHLLAFAMRRRTDVEVLYSPAIDASTHEDGAALAEQVHAYVAAPVPMTVDPDRELGWLERPLIRETEVSLWRGRYVIRIFDQPGRWMIRSRLDALTADLRVVAEDGMDDVPTYGVFTGRRSAFANRVIAVAYHGESGRPVAFTAMVYLPVSTPRGIETVIHLGLTIIARAHRGQRLQTPLFRKIFLLPILNQRRLEFTMTSIAASPAGVGAASDYFFDTFPAYHGRMERSARHLDVATQVLSSHRHEFGCSTSARFDPETFIVHGSNAPEDGGAFQFVKGDPVSRYRVESCNEWCRDRLDYSAGDEQFQVGRAAILPALWSSRRTSRGA